MHVMVVPEMYVPEMHSCQRTCDDVVRDRNRGKYCYEEEGYKRKPNVEHLCYCDMKLSDFELVERFLTEDGRCVSKYECIDGPYIEEDYYEDPLRI